MNKKQIRQKFRDEVFKRDHLKCRVCNTQLTEQSADAHHITDRTEMPYQGYSLSNGITLCSACHMKAEEFHINEGLAWVGGMHPDDLYRLIGSSYERAHTDCLQKQIRNDLI